MHACRGLITIAVTDTYTLIITITIHLFLIAVTSSKRNMVFFNIWVVQNSPWLQLHTYYSHLCTAKILFSFLLATYSLLLTEAEEQQSPHKDWKIVKIAAPSPQHCTLVTIVLRCMLWNFQTYLGLACILRLATTVVQSNSAAPQQHLSVLCHYLCQVNSTMDTLNSDSVEKKPLYRTHLKFLLYITSIL